MLQYLKVGQIINTHGVRGEVKVFPLTDDIRRFSKLKQVFMNAGEDFISVPIESIKYLNDIIILKLANVNDMNHAQKLKNQYIFVDRENAVRLPKDSYFIADLIGLEVITEDGEVLGKLASVFSTGSNDVYDIKQENGKSILVPAIKDVVKAIDIESRKMIIKLLEGLI